MIPELFLAIFPEKLYIERKYKGTFMDLPPLFEKILKEYYLPGPLQETLFSHSMQVWEKAEKLRESLALPLTEEEVALGALLHDIAIFQCHAPDIHCFGKAL